MNPQEITEALEALYPGSGASVLRNEGGDLTITWGRAEPVPDEATIEAAIAALPQRRQQRDDAARQLRQQIVALAQSAVGVRVDNLTAGQVRALLVVQLHKAGALNADGTVRPLGEWA